MILCLHGRKVWRGLITLLFSDERSVIYDLIMNAFIDMRPHF